MIAVDDMVYAQIPFTPGWDTVNPKEYGAPDPSTLTRRRRLSGLLGMTESIETGESVRGGADNDEVLTTYTGTVPGDAMESVIPLVGRRLVRRRVAGHRRRRAAQGHAHRRLLPPDRRR